MSIVELNNLTKYYGKSRGIKDINLSVNEKEILGFIGPNGAGKSTTIRTLLGLQEPTSGFATIFGKNITKDKCEILKNIGYIPSEVMFYPEMSVKQIIKYSANLRKIDCTKEAKELCNKLDLDVNKKISSLSLGNRKKVSIVCAMQHNPKLYILDEATSGLDPLIQQEFFLLLKEKRKHGATIIFSSHVLSEVQHYCDRAAIIKEGRLIKVAKVEDLLKSNSKRVTILGIHENLKLSGMSDIINHERGISFLYNGNLKELILKLSSINFSDISISEPDLEETFTNYYGDEKL